MPGKSIPKLIQECSQKWAGRADEKIPAYFLL